ncbi:multifunctional CCA addition/repair protein [Neisseria sp. Ec49-e6-T10]|uniref:multifunctional CCA addition/repair protein n=1 Tax=Neisseria sp. Ec49-e6-T10 TaxID=3140744 RepID=UPI003EBD8663
MIKTYLVGGAVRDELLKLPVKDKDWVVVGATPEYMLSNGFTLVGQDFPVFLHPNTHEEYALARTERKTHKGYTGFQVFSSPDITLEEDLARRDLTINAIAKDADTGEIIDPYQGLEDLTNGVLRHVSPAFVEDPVRILRLARFAARFGFSIAPETLDLMKQMVADGEVDALVPERVWQELAKGLMERQPSLMIKALHECHALEKILPEVAALFGVPQREKYHPEIDTGIHTLMVIDMAAKMQLNLAQRFSALVHDLGKALTPKDILPGHNGHDKRGLIPLENMVKRLKVPNECSDLAQLVVREHILLHSAFELTPKVALKILAFCDAFRRPKRFTQALDVCIADIRGRLGKEDSPYPQYEHWLNLLKAANSIHAKSIAQNTENPHDIAQNIFKARLEKLTPVQLEKKGHLNGHY